jgi:hypothetical protein
MPIKDHHVIIQMCNFLRVRVTIMKKPAVSSPGSPKYGNCCNQNHCFLPKTNLQVFLSQSKLISQLSSVAVYFSILI